MINVEEYIPYGKENAISRADLAKLTGLSDRVLRSEIHIARRKHAILNLQNGGGYYRPTEEDVNEAQHFYNQEHSRAMSILWSLRGIKKWLKEGKNGI